MRKFFTLLFAVVCTVSMSAQMRVWKNGEKLFELNLSSIDSITFVKPDKPDTTTTPVNPDTVPSTASTFDYDHWREQTEIAIYGYKDPVALPWAAVAATSILDEYKHPEKELQADSITPRWQLAFNLCNNANLPGIDLFGLWDSRSMVMRIYSYIEKSPNQNAKYFFYEIESSAPVFIDGDTKGWQPSQAIISSCSWNGTMPDKYSQPSTKISQLLPITGTLDGEINPGWLCFELRFSSGIFDVKPDDHITFTLYGLEQMDFTGSMNISGELADHDGKLTIPGSKNKKAGGILSAVGGLISSTADFVMKGMAEGASGIAAGVGIAGAATSFAGGIFSSVNESSDKTYTLDLDFQITAEADINGTLSSRLGTEVNPTQLDYSAFFENIIEHSTTDSAANSAANSAAHRAPAQPDKLATSAWNLQQQPVIYVCNDALNKFVKSGFGTQWKYYYVTFLDPTSIQLALNTQNILFDMSDVAKISLVAYDFAFVSDKYSMPAKPYYDFYGISSDAALHYQQSTLAFPFGSDDIKMYLLDTTAQASDASHDGLTYTGVAFNYDSKYDMDAYNQIVSPAIEPIVSSPSGYVVNGSLDNLGVAVLLELEFKNGDKRLFADRFLPQVKGFSIKDAPALYDSIQNSTAPTTFNDIAMEVPLYDSLKSKALRLLEPIHEAVTDSFPIVRIALATDNYNSVDKYGIRIREYQNADSLGVVLRVHIRNYNIDDELHTYSFATMEWLRSLLNETQWNTVDAKFKRFGMPSLNNDYVMQTHETNKWCESPFGYCTYHSYNIITGEESLEKDTGFYIDIYYEDADGNLTLYTE